MSPASQQPSFDPAHSITVMVEGANDLMSEARGLMAQCQIVEDRFYKTYAKKKAA